VTLARLRLARLVEPMQLLAGLGELAAHT